MNKHASGASVFISVRVASICALLIVGSAIGCRFLGDGQTLTAALKLVTATLAVGVVPGALATMLWRPRRALTLLEVIGFGVAISFGLVHLIAVFAVSAHVGTSITLGMLAIASTLMAIRTIWRPLGVVVITLDELIVLSLLLALSVFLYNLGSPVTWWEDQVHLSIVRRLSELASPRLDNLYVTPGIVYSYPIPGTHYFMALIARLSELDALFVYHKLRFFWGPIALVMLYLAARAVFGPKGIASGVTVTATTLVCSGAFAMVPGFDSGWGQLATFSHASDIAMNVLLPALLVVACGYLTGQMPRERCFFLMATVMLVVMLTMVHIREIVQAAVYMICLAMVAVMVRPFRACLRRSVALVCLFVGVAVIYVLWQRQVVGLVSDIVQTHRAQLTTIVTTTPLQHLITSPAPVLLHDFLINSDQTSGGLIPLFLFAGPAVLLVFSERSLVWLMSSSTFVYLGIMAVPLLAIPYIYLTYFEILYTPVRNVAFFVYLIAGSAICAGVLALARIDRTRLLPLPAGTLAGALTILVTLSFNRSAGGFITPLIAAYGLGFLWTSSLRTNRVRAVAALALGLLGLVALFPEREVAQRNQVSVRWTSGLPEGERVALERQFALSAAEPNSNYSQDVNVWNYDLTDVSPGNIKALVNHPRVVDTNDIDRSTFTVLARLPEDDHPYVGVTRIAWLQHPGFLLFVAAAASIWALGFLVPAILASPAGRRAVASFQPALDAPFYRSAVPFVLFMIPFTVLTARATLSPLTVAPSLPGGRADTPASMVARIPCVTTRGAAARFASGDDVVPERTTCPPDRDLTEWVRTNVPADGVFAVDRWMAYAPQVFMPQQAVTFPALDATFLNEDQLFGDYYKFFDERMQRDRVQPFFNSVETTAERTAFVEALRVTHVLVNPPYYAELRAALDALPELFTLRYDRAQWAVYEVTRKSPAGAAAAVDRFAQVAYDERDTVTIQASETLALRGGTPVRSTFLPFHQPLIDAEDELAVIETLRSGWLTSGPRTKGFETELASYTGSRHCVAVNSCTAALHLALDAAGVGPGDEVVTSPITFASTANVIVHRGARPVFVDVEPDTFNIDPAAIDAGITEKTKAVIPVDFAGHPCELDPIMALGVRHGLTVIEDAAHAIGAEYKGRRVGGIAHMTCFSFYATKNITSGEGGALTTNDSERADRIAIMALHGISRDAWKRYGTDGYRHWDIIAPGYKYNMFDVQAALVRSQFEKMERFHSRRIVLKARLDAGLRDLPELGLPGERPWVKHAFHLYPIIVRTELLTADRDVVMNAIQAENVGIGIHFRAVHLHPFYTETFGFGRGMCPHAEYYSDRTISLPLYPKMTDRDADDVIDAVRKVITYFRR